MRTKRYGRRDVGSRVVVGKIMGKIRGGLSFEGLFALLREVDPTITREKALEAYREKKAAYIGQTMAGSGLSDEQRQQSLETTKAIAVESHQALLDIVERHPEWLNGSACTFVVRKDDDRVIVSAEKCHAKGVVSPIHVDPDGTARQGGKPYRNRRKHAAVEE